MTHLPTTIVALTVGLELNTSTLTLIVLVEVMVFSLGALLGATLQDRVHETERRRWKARNAALIEQMQVMAAYAEQSEDDAR